MGYPAFTFSVKSMPSNYHDVLRFHQHLDLPVRDEPTAVSCKELNARIKFLQEELDELKGFARRLEARRINNVATPDAWLREILAGIFDSLIDLVYVAHGTAIQLGMPWEQGWERVQAANMQKERSTDESGHKLGVVKPEGWKPPDIAGCILLFQNTIEGFRNSYGAETALRCKHGLHKISDVCDACADEAIVGIKPSTRGKLSKTETGRFRTDRPSMTNIPRDDFGGKKGGGETT